MSMPVNGSEISVQLCVEIRNIYSYELHEIK